MNPEPEIDSAAPAKRHQEWKVVAALLLVLIGLEGGSRLFESRLSEDIRHLRSLPETAREIGDRDPEDETTLVIGNSLARRGLDAGRLRAGLDEKAGGAGSSHLEFFVPDASSISEWSWGLRRYFAKERVRRLKRIIVVSGRSHLLDRPGNPERQGAYFVGRRDLPEAVAAMGSYEESLRLVLGNFSRLAANRDRLRPLVGYRFLPGFEAAWPRVVVAGYEATVDRLGDAAGLWELDSLRRLLDHAVGLEAEVVVVAVPLPDRYRLPEAVTRLLEERRVALIDLSVTPGIEASNFPDGYHLDEDGAAAFTEALLKSLP